MVVFLFGCIAFWLTLVADGKGWRRPKILEGNKLPNSCQRTLRYENGLNSIERRADDLQNYNRIGKMQSWYALSQAHDEHMVSNLQ